MTGDLVPVVAVLFVLEVTLFLLGLRLVWPQLRKIILQILGAEQNDQSNKKR